jgi:hypothetical protein
MKAAEPGEKVDEAERLHFRPVNGGHCIASAFSVRAASPLPQRVGARQPGRLYVYTV